jgi:3-hydroxyisobutyrate dehydrogenase
MLSGEFKPGFKLGLHQKDLSICQSMIRSISENALPIIEMTLIHYKQLIDEGYGDEDISALFRLKQKNLR